MDFARIVLRDLGRNIRRTAMTVTSIAVSLFVFSALMSFAKVPDQIRANANNSVRLVCRNKAGLGHGLPQAYTPKIRGLPHIVAVSAWNFFGSRYRRPDDTFPTIDVDVQDLETIWPEWQIQPAALAAFRKIRRAALVAPILVRHRAQPDVRGFVKGAYAAAIGTILGASVLLGKIAIGDWLTALITVASLLVLFRWKVSNPMLVAATAIVGIIAFPILGPDWVFVK